MVSRVRSIAQRLPVRRSPTSTGRPSSRVGAFIRAVPQRCSRGGSLRFSPCVTGTATRCWLWSRGCLHLEVRREKLRPLRKRVDERQSSAMKKKPKRARAEKISARDPMVQLANRALISDDTGDVMRAGAAKMGAALDAEEQLRRDLVAVFCSGVRAAKESGASAAVAAEAFLAALRKFYGKAPKSTKPNAVGAVLESNRLVARLAAAPSRSAAMASASK